MGQEKVCLRLLQFGYHDWAIYLASDQTPYSLHFKEIKDLFLKNDFLLYANTGYILDEIM